MKTRIPSRIYRGVYESTNKRREWISIIVFKGEEIILGYFKQEQAAAITYNKYVRHYGLPLENLNTIVTRGV